MSEEKLKSQETEEGLQSFAEAAEEYGIELDVEKWPDGTEVLKQIHRDTERSWPGLGFDPEGYVWLGLTPEGQSKGDVWQANTVLESGEGYRGLTTGPEGQVDASHPLAQLAGEVYLTGDHTGWALNEEARLERDEEGNLRGNIPENTEVKAAVLVQDRNEVTWDDGNWKYGAEQTLKLKPKPEVDFGEA